MAEVMKQELWLFTMRFPFGNGEAFLESELPILCSGFERVRIFPLLPIGEERPLPENADVVRLFGPDEVHRPIPFWRLMTDLRRFLQVWRMSLRSAPSRTVFAKHSRELMSQLRQAFNRERMLRARMASAYDPERVVLYSYWASDWATVLGLWKLRDERVRFVSRMMGFEMFDHRAPDSWQRFQTFHVAQADHAYMIAEAGLAHMQQRFPEAVGKFSIAYLATRDHGAAPWSPAEELRIVSCSNLIPLKRVHLIAQAVGLLQGPVWWTHFGDGPERERIEAIVHRFPANISVDLKGSRPNVEVMAWYSAHPADVFVHTSRTEGGAPVALQEAASFGIPLLAADAGGVREVVTLESGVLLPNDITTARLAETLDTFRGSHWYDKEARQLVRSFWASKFKAEDVHSRLLKELLKGSD